MHEVAGKVWISVVTNNRNRNFNQKKTDSIHQ